MEDMALWQWVPKTIGGGVLRRSPGKGHNMGFVIHKGVREGIMHIT